ncbi:hypothetical protein [Duganella radicis]|uniref:Type IV pilus biogenesis protein PilP n=1 Tax=Duganella radicis TaxID=551988 RepID=A0A6L6PBK8_9BURK|nr:hypothetical protein [Duganella radicis]MTV36442.1 hypothetical protein [Duganella radicis]
MKALLVLLAVSGSALASDADLLRCRAIPDVSSRVACYDAIPVATTAPAPVAKTVPVAPVATAAPAAVAAPAADPAANFGLSASQMRKSDEPNAIESTLLGRIEGWSPSTQFRLANGQIWRVADDSSGYVTEVENPKVKITRNGIGTMFLEIEGANQAPRVRRVQ